MKDIVSTWARLYKERGWNKYAQFNAKGGFNRPYILFKAKNVLNLETREVKWAKARPIAPGTKHPMRKLLGLVGRAWSFVVARKNNPLRESFVIDHSGQVPSVLRRGGGAAAFL